MQEKQIRNIAIIAHVDHGKTTLTDQILKQTGAAIEGTTMDSNTLEQERGITIYSKNASVEYKGTKINIVDTPGHSDFGSEVERVLRAIDSVLLIVDAQEGPMPQTRFVLKKSLEIGLKPIVVINKIDKPASDPARVHDEVLELFIDLGANDDQLNFTVVYAIGREGIAKKELADVSTNLDPLLDTILEQVANADKGKENPLQMQVFNLGYDNFVGRMGICRIYAGTVKVGSTIWAKHPDGKFVSSKITKMFAFKGLDRVETQEAEAGDIVMVAGIANIEIGDTITDAEATPALPAIKVDEPTISLNFLVNDSPFGGREGKFVTNRQIRERLEKELEINVGLKVDFGADGAIVYGRGELHIGILLENMRREGYEVQVSQPKVIFKEIDGQKFEPFEEVTVDVPEAYYSRVIEKLSPRKGILMSMKQDHGSTYRLIFEIPTRGFLGYRNQFIIDTKGEGILSSRFLEFRPHVGHIDRHTTGAMISMESGKALTFALFNLSERGTIFIDPTEEVYEGMVIGDVVKGDDLYVNPTKGKQLTNMRASGSDEHMILQPAWKLSIERAMEVMREDEYIEITPTNIRLRKIYRNKSERDKAERQSKKD
ncbi:MAG TPA: translational GTPase TypA [Candidatus Paceibacterota bacterium]|nr:translational GTPase TypA [Candidatus Paceibacterota bacterium]